MINNTITKYLIGITIATNYCISLCCYHQNHHRLPSLHRCQHPHPQHHRCLCRHHQIPIHLISAPPIYVLT
jgi:hypothetical protein